MRGPSTRSAVKRVQNKWVPPTSSKKAASAQKSPLRRREVVRLRVTLVDWSRVSSEWPLTVQPPQKRAHAPLANDASICDSVFSKAKAAIASKTLITQRY
jgi:hypothetical protein